MHAAFLAAQQVALGGGDAFLSESKATARAYPKDALRYLELQWTLKRRN